MKKILNAALYAAEKHSGQKRKNVDASPYINHPLEVAEVLAGAGGVTEEDVLVAALLHDVIEDTDTEPEEVSTVFGPAVLGYVMEVTDDKSLPKAERKRLTIEHAPSMSEGAKQVELADRIANIRSVANDPPKDWPIARQREYFDWSYSVFEGLRGTNQELDALFLMENEEGRKKVDRRAEESNKSL